MAIVREDVRKGEYYVARIANYEKMSEHKAIIFINDIVLGRILFTAVSDVDQEVYVDVTLENFEVLQHINLH